uniref:Uncharacterized protein n=1 Tax=Neogobius melanostomus TaxID=47308 RepID=A0A8C6WL58_9GOBI
IGIVTTLTKADIGIRKPVTQVGLPSRIRQESGLKVEHTVNDAYLTWDQSIYLKQQCQMLGEAVQDLDFNRPDISKLEVIGSSKPYFCETCSDSSSENTPETPVLVDLLPVFVEELEDPAMAAKDYALRCWKQKIYICKTPYHQLTFEEKLMYWKQMFLNTIIDPALWKLGSPPFREGTLLDPSFKDFDSSWTKY